MHFVIRIRRGWLRLPLLCLLFPAEILCYVGQALLPVAIGGHPNKKRVLQADFYALPLALFWAAWHGTFVRGRKT